LGLLIRGASLAATLLVEQQPLQGRDPISTAHVKLNISIISNAFEYLESFITESKIRIFPLQVQLNSVVLFLPTLRLSKNLDLDNSTQAFFYF